MAFVSRRFFSTSPGRMWNALPTLARPTPMGMKPVIDTPELRALQEKAQSSWKNLTKEEKISLYRATYKLTYKEIRNYGKGEWTKVFLITGVLTGFGIWLSEFLRVKIGPAKPHTVGNKEWIAASKEKLLRQKANPVEGLCSK